MLAVLPFCLSACISACMSVCAPGPVGLSQSADYTHDKPPLPACLAFWGFQALRIPSPGFLSPRLTPVLHCLLFFPPISLGWAHGASPLFALAQPVTRNCWLLANAGIAERRVARFSRLCLVTAPATSPNPASLLCKQSSLSPTIKPAHVVYYGNKKQITCSWFEWINIPSACLLFAWRYRQP